MSPWRERRDDDSEREDTRESEDSNGLVASASGSSVFQPSAAEPTIEAVTLPGGGVVFDVTESAVAAAQADMSSLGSDTARGIAAAGAGPIVAPARLLREVDVPSFVVGTLVAWLVLPGTVVVVVDPTRFQRIEAVVRNFGLSVDEVAVVTSTAAPAVLVGLAVDRMLIVGVPAAQRGVLPGARETVAVDITASSDSAVTLDS